MEKSEKKVIGIIAAIICLAVVVRAVGGGPAEVAKPPARLLVKVCEQELADRLYAPASYRRVEESALLSAPASWEVYYGMDVPGKRAYFESLQRGTQSERELAVELRAIYDRMAAPTEHAVIVTYEAQNALGVALRNKFLCSIVVDGDLRADAVNGRDVRVDGYTSMDWALARARGAAR